MYTMPRTPAGTDESNSGDGVNRFDDLDQATEPTGVDDFDRTAAILTDGVIGAVGGFVGTILMAITFFAAESAGVFSTAAFASVAKIVAPATDASAMTGLLVFLVGGMVLWPPLFAAIRGYLPGSRDLVSGLAFGVFIWPGFAIGFADGYAGGGFALYVAATLLAHALYGLSLGAAFELLGDKPAFTV